MLHGEHDVKVCSTVYVRYIGKKTLNWSQRFELLDMGVLRVPGFYLCSATLRRQLGIAVSARLGVSRKEPLAGRRPQPHGLAQTWDCW